jgi:hypothetical protein
MKPAIIGDWRLFVCSYECLISLMLFCARAQTEDAHYRHKSMLDGLR